MNELASYAAIPRPALAAWAFDALEEVAHEISGVGGGAFYRQSPSAVIDRRLPCCITTIATVAALRMGLAWNRIIIELTWIGISPDVNDIAVASICDAHGWPRTARVPWIEYIAEIGLVRDETIEAPVSSLFSPLTAPATRRAQVH